MLFSKKFVVHRKESHSLRERCHRRGPQDPSPLRECHCQAEVIKAQYHGQQQDISHYPRWL